MQYEISVAIGDNAKVSEDPNHCTIGGYTMSDNGKRRFKEVIPTNSQCKTGVSVSALYQ